MDVRRVQITGGSSFMITLPKEWANSVELKKNDTVGVRAQPDGTLLLFPKNSIPSPKRSTKVIDASDMRDHALFYRQLVGAYIAGHSMLLIKSVQPMPQELVSVVTNFVQTAIGLEMIEADDSHILIANLIEHDALDPMKTVERMASLVKDMMSNLYEAAFTGDHEKINNMASKDTEVDRIFWLISRQHDIFSKDGAVSADKFSMNEMDHYLFISRILEGIGDTVVNMSECLTSVEKRKDAGDVDKNARRSGQSMIEILSKTMKGWADKDIMLANQAMEEAEKIIGDADKALFKTNRTAASPISEIISFVSRRIAEYCRTIDEFTFNLAMK